MEGAGGVYGVGDPWIAFGSFLDHFGPFCSLYFQRCANGLVDLCIIFLEAKLLEQVNLHFWIIYNTHCWFNMLLCTCTIRHTYVWKLRFWIIFVNMNWWIISFLELAFLDHVFFHTNWWIISFLELSETKVIQKCKFQKRNDPPICVEKI